MKSKVTNSNLVFAFLIVLISAAGVRADVGTWSWEGTGVSFDFNLNLSSLPSGYTFNLVSFEKDAIPYTLIKNTTFGGTLDIQYNIEQNGYVASIYANQFNPSLKTGEVFLGDNDTFGFSFFNGSAYSSVYELITLGANTYMLKSGDGAMAVNFQSTAIATAVPIPGSALLLGSGLLGLVGIGARRKRA